MTNPLRNVALNAEAQRVYTLARQRQQARETTATPIDYDAMNRIYPRQKAALTRAINSKDPAKILLCVRDAVQAWERIGAWPDGWHRWQNAVDDVLRYNQSIDIRDLA